MDRVHEADAARAAEAHGIRNAALETNIGNAALQAEHLGSAVLAYRRALALDPGHAQARENLGHARDLLPAWVPRPREDALGDTFFFWRRALAESTRNALAALLFFLAAALAAVWVRWRKAWARNLAVLPLLAWVALIGMPLLERSGAGPDAAVVTASEALVRAADSPGAPTRFAEPLPGGSEVEIVEVRSDWARIRLADGRDGWVSQGRVERVARQR